MKKNYAIYCRVSTEEQKQNNSVAGQLGAIKNYIENHNDKYEFDESLVYADEGESGATHYTIRPRLRDLHKEIKAGNIKTVFVLRIDRLFRKLRFLLEFMEEIGKHDCEIIFLDFPELSSSVFGKAMFQMIGMLAEVEHTLIEQRSREGRLAAASNGKWLGGNLPFGFDIDENNFFKPHEEEAILLREMYRRLTEERWTISELVTFVNSKKLQQKKLKKNNRGELWRFDSKRLISLLKSEASIGRLYYGKSKIITDDKGRKKQVKQKKTEEMICITAPRIISDEMFYKAQVTLQQLESERRRKIRKKDGEQDYLFAGLITCGGCNKKWTGKLSTRMTPQYQHRRPTGLTCSVQKNSISEHVLEQAVLPIIMQFLTNPRNYLPHLEVKLKSLNKDKAKAKKRIIDLEKEIETLKTEGKRINLYCVKNDLPNEERLAILAENESEIGELQESLNAEKNLLCLHAEQNDRIQHLEELEKVYRQDIKNPTHENKKRIIQTFVSKIMLSDDEIHVDFSFFDEPDADTNKQASNTPNMVDTNKKPLFQAKKATLVAENAIDGAQERT